MPKMKTHSGAKKRFRITGKGKIMRQRTHMRHNLEGKASTRTRRLSKDVEISPADTRTVKKLLGR